MKKHAILAACMISAFFISNIFAATELVSHGLGVTFSGDHSTGSPTLSSLNNDLNTAANHFSFIRTYSSQYSGGKLDLLKYITPLGNLNILIGIPLNTTTYSQLNSIAANLRTNPKLKSRITGILIGNETGNSSTPQLLKYIDKAKKLFPTIPISSAQAWDFWVQDFKSSYGVTSKADFIAINLYPNWCWGQAGNDKQPISHCWDPSSSYSPQKAAISIAEGYQYLKGLNKKFPHKKLVVTETGWPTTFGEYGSADVRIGATNSKTYINLVNSWAKSNKINVYMYSMFDDIYADPSNFFSTHFGYVNAQNNFKFSLDKYSIPQ